MNKNARSIGDIASNGGFPKAIDAVATTGRSLVILKNGQPVVAMIPCSESTSVYLQHRERLDGILQLLVGKDEIIDTDIQDFLMYQVSMGAYAKAILLAVPGRSSELIMKITEIENRLLHRFGERFQKNSSGEGGSVSPMTTARTDVSTVKHKEESDNADSSLPRKRGRPRSVIK